MSRNALTDLHLLFFILNQQKINEDQFSEAVEHWVQNPRTEMITILRELKFVDLSAKLNETETAPEFSMLTAHTLRHRSEPVDKSQKLPFQISSSEEATQIARAAGTLESRFDLHECIGRGGEGTVHRGYHKELGRDIAIKVMYSEFADQPKRLISFLNEARVMALLEHPNIPSVYGFGCLEDGRAAIVMELLSKQTLKNKIKDFHNSSQGFRCREFFELIESLSTVCRALNHAHGVALAHRDIKPSNIFIGEQGTVHLGDWGLSRAVQNQEKTSTPTDNTPQDASSPTSGTLPFIAPERLGDSSICNSAVDIYSLGVTLYQVLTGRLPFDSDSYDDILVGEFILPRSINRRIPVGLEKVCLKAMAKDPNQRYKTATDFKQDLDSWRTGLALTVYDPPSAKATRFLTVNFKAVCAGLVVAAFGILAIFVFGQWKQREIQSANESLAKLNGKLEDVNSSLRVEKQIADQSLKDAQEIVNSFLYDRSLLYFVNEPVRSAINNRALATQARDYYLEFLKHNKEVVDVAQFARIRLHLGLLYLQIGDLQNARIETLKGQEVFTRLLAKSPDDPSLQKEVADTSHSLAIINSVHGDFEASEKNARNAIEMMTSQSDDESDEINHVVSRYRATLGTALQRQGKVREAKSMFEQAMPVTGNIQDTGEFENRLFKSQVLNQLGELASNSGNPDTALEKFEECVSLFENFKLSPEHRTHSNYILAIAKINMGKVYLAKGQLKLAKQISQEGANLITPIVQLFPEETPYHTIRLNAFANLAAVASLQNQSVEGLKYADNIFQFFEEAPASKYENWKMVRVVCDCHQYRSLMKQQAGEVPTALESANTAFELLQRFVTRDHLPKNFGRRLVVQLRNRYALTLQSKDFDALNTVLEQIHSFRNNPKLPITFTFFGNELHQVAGRLGQESPEHLDEALARLSEYQPQYLDAYKKDPQIKFRLMAFDATIQSIKLLAFAKRFDEMDELINVGEKDLEELLLLTDQTPAKRACEQGWKSAMIRCTNAHAWDLATNNSPELRDGKKAVQLALENCKTTQWRVANHLDTLAAAYAENGDMEKAIETIKKAIKLTAGPKKTEFENHLKEFQENRPIREND